MPPPVVTGLSPKEGPPGTRITIRGEFLGTRPNDLVGLKICDCDCLLSAEWKSPNKIIARTGPAKGKGDIIVTTLSGGVGSSTVQFRAYHETIGPMKESAVWIEESPTQSLAWGRRSLAPSGYFTQEDPLGLSIEGNEKKLTEDLRDLFPDSSGDLSQENFSPGWFLLEHHNSTSFEDLKAGLAYLKRKVESQRDGQLSFLKANAGSVIDQLDTLMTLRTKFQEDIKEYGTESIKPLETAIQKSIIQSNSLFTDVLNRREKADATRAALFALARHKFLFCLPNSVERSAKKEQYDVVVSDYARAKNLFGKTELPIFKKVLEEVDLRIMGIRKDLHKKVCHMPQSVDQQKKFVKALINLEIQQISSSVVNQLTIEDPAWDAIEARTKYLEETFKLTFEQFIGKEITQSKSRDQNTLSVNDPTVTASPSSVALSSASSSNIPIRVQFCEEISEIGASQIPDLWRLGQSYFTGELRGVNEPKPGNFKRIIITSVEQFCCYLRTAIFSISTLQNQRIQHLVMSGVTGGGNSTSAQTICWPNTNSSTNNQFLSWLPQCLRFVRILYATLIRLDLPNEVLDIIQKLIDQIRLICLTTVFKKANDRVKQLENRETWQMNVADFPGVTLLPSYLEEILIEILEEAQQTCITPEQRESIILEPQSEGQRELSQRLQEILTIFCNVLETLAYQRLDDDEHQLSQGVSQLIGFPNNTSMVSTTSSSPSSKLSTLNNTTTTLLQNGLQQHNDSNLYDNNNTNNSIMFAVNSVISWEQRLLCCLANCVYCNKYFFTNLGTIFTRFGYPVPMLAIESGKLTVNVLYNSILDTYVEHKSDPLVGTIEPSMYIGRFQWNGVKETNKLRPYAHECLDNLVGVYSEIFHISPQLLRPVLEPIIQMVAEELARLMSCVQKFNANGAIQSNIDIRLLKDALKLYSNETAKIFFGEALDAIPKLSSDGEKYVDETLRQIKNSMKLQLMCFSVQNP